MTDRYSNQMNQLKGIITSVRSEGNLSLATLDAGGLSVTAIVIDTPASAPWMVVGTQVLARVKETEVVIARDWSGHISMRNRWPARIESVQAGSLLTSVQLICGGNLIVSLITTQSATEMNLRPGDEVTALVKTNEISIGLP
jgi:molybdate transport system regulatory protein